MTASNQPSPQELVATILEGMGKVEQLGQKIAGYQREIADAESRAANRGWLASLFVIESVPGEKAKGKIIDATNQVADLRVASRDSFVKVLDYVVLGQGNWKGLEQAELVDGYKAARHDLAEALDTAKSIARFKKQVKNFRSDAPAQQEISEKQIDRETADIGAFIDTLFNVIVNVALLSSDSGLANAVGAAKVAGEVTGAFEDSSKQKGSTSTTVSKSNQVDGTKIYRELASEALKIGRSVSEFVANADKLKDDSAFAGIASAMTLPPSDRYYSTALDKALHELPACEILNRLRAEKATQALLDIALQAAGMGAMQQSGLVTQGQEVISQKIVSVMMTASQRYEELVKTSEATLIRMVSSSKAQSTAPAPKA